MPNSANVCIDPRGTPEAVAAAVADDRLAGSLFADGFVYVESSWATRFEGLDAISRDHPDVVFSTAAVECANRRGEALVLHAGENVGEYEMSDDEFEEAAGDDLEEAPVLDSLSSTVESYVDDALRASRPKI